MPETTDAAAFTAAVAAPIGHSHRKYVSIDMRARESALESKRYQRHCNIRSRDMRYDVDFSLRLTVSKLIDTRPRRVAVEFGPFDARKFNRQRFIRVKSRP